MSCSRGCREPWRTSGHLALEDPAGVADGVVEDDVGGGGLVQHLQAWHHEYGRARLLGGNISDGFNFNVYTCFQNKQE